MDRLKRLTEEVRRLAVEELPLGEMSDAELEERIERMISERSESKYLSIARRAEAVAAVISSIRGFGILDILLSDEKITEIMVNSHDVIFIEREGTTYRTDIRFESRDQLEDVIQRIVGRAGREVNQANPIVDARLPDGSRVNVVLPPISLNGPVLTIRKFSDEPFTVDRLIELGSLTEEAAEKLEMLVRAKYNIFISGGTNSGKTTFLNALAGFIPKDERIVLIEDSAELRLNGIENLIRMETRNANSSGAGLVTMRQLIRASLRMRPERIIVGEVRGEEALDMLQAMNTGHDGSLSTGHANSTQDMLSRLETMVFMGTSSLPQEAVRRQIASAIDIMIHLSRLRDHSRRVISITEVAGYRRGEIQLNPLFVFEEDPGRSTGERVSGRLKRTKNSLLHENKLKLYGVSGTI
ncbi:MAG: CpaF family protein [Clostridiales bacterium]|nr:CpaF family protein [Clostridiales bacterium]